MSTPKQVLIATLLDEEQLKGLQDQFGPQVAFHHHPIKQNESIPADILQAAEVLYTNNYLPAPEQAPRLRWVQFDQAGIETHLDHPLMAQPELLATTTSGANAPQVAEHALSMMLALGHKLPNMLNDQSQHKWSARRLERYVPHELNGATVGMVGYGSIGQYLAHLLQPFGVTILASRRDIMHPRDNDYLPEGYGDAEARLVRRLYPGKALRTMLKACDFVVVAVPLTGETRGLISAKQLDAMHPTAFLVDVSRGGVVDQAALLASLDGGKLAGAALDGFPEEPLPADSPMWEHPNVIISPHVAGLSQYYQSRYMLLFAENLRRFLAGVPLLNLVDPHRGY